MRKRSSRLNILEHLLRKGMIWQRTQQWFDEKIANCFCCC